MLDIYKHLCVHQLFPSIPFQSKCQCTSKIKVRSNATTNTSTIDNLYDWDFWFESGGKLLEDLC